MKLAPLFLAILLSPGLIASETDFVSWQSVVIKSAEIPEAGVVTIKANLDGDEWKSLVVEAHGRKHEMVAEELKALKGFPLSSISVTAEAGYQPIGGHTVSLRFKRIFIDEKKLQKTQLAHWMMPKFGPAKVLISSE
jgi:hypothetical protein